MEKTIEVTSPATGLPFELHMNGSDGYFTNPITGEDIPCELVNGCLCVKLKFFNDCASLSLSEAADELGISAQGVCNLIARGKIHAVSYQRVTRVLAGDVMERSK